MKIAIAATDGAIRQGWREVGFGPDDLVVDLGQAGDARAELDDPDLRVLILDWSSTRFDGPALCRRIRLRGPADPYLYIVAVVGTDQPSEQLAAFRSGADAVVVEPLDGDEIRVRVEVARRISGRMESLRKRSEELEQVRRDLESRVATLAEIASSDALTGLRNRRYFGEALEAQFSLARRKGMPMSLVMIDVDQFKDFNDRFGHLAGDDVLRDVGAILQACVRDHDIVVRYGGEEFAILLPATREDECLSLVERLRAAIADHAWTLRPVTISLGAATLDAAVIHPPELVDQADRALYFSKALGRNRGTHSRDLPAFDADTMPDRMTGEPMFSPNFSSP